MISRRASLRRPKSRRSQRDEGRAWLIFDAGGELFQYQCYWMGGPCDDHLREHARAVSDADGVAWAAQRTSHARIRMPDHVTYWAGTGPRPAGFSRSWRPPTETAVPAVASRHARLMAA